LHGVAVVPVAAVFAPIRPVLASVPPVFETVTTIFAPIPLIFVTIAAIAPLSGYRRRIEPCARCHEDGHDCGSDAVHWNSSPRGDRPG
jgi:hypothetical protein